ncbi:ABC transporter permease, partial [Clostridium perfringens]|nr:ABC transporter permease [Clostridium perfringens]
TDWFIRWPFIIEGMIIGIVGSLFASLSLFALYKWAYGYIVSNMFLVTLVTPGFVLGTLTWIFILGGTIVGAVGSSVALRKFLDV